jgi:hypothetical protein
VRRHRSGIFRLDNFLDCLTGFGVGGPKFRHFIFEVTQDDFFNGNSSCADGGTAEDTGDYSKSQSAESTEMVAAATAYVANAQMVCEMRPVAFVMGFEFQPLRYEFRCQPAINIHRYRRADDFIVISATSATNRAEREKHIEEARKENQKGFMVRGYRKQTYNDGRVV